MSQIYSQSADTGAMSGPSAGALVIIAARRWYSAYLLWRLERMAIAQLESLSDRQLADVGLARGGIWSAVKSPIAPHSALQA